jgi:secreted trypsin-like serine protease
MDYRVPQYAVAPAVAAAKTSVIKIVVIILAVVVVVFLIIAAVAIALGVGLGIGLKKNSDSSSSSDSTITTTTSTSTSTSSTIYSILAAPIVKCNYGGSSTCGCSATQPSFLSPRIHQGYTATTNSWPWMIALYINNNQTFCGGFLISYQHVVTAAHCVIGLSSTSVIAYAGIQTLSSRSSGQARISSVITVHPSYSLSATVYDIAIITLQSAFNQTATVGLCCVTYDTSLPSVGQTGAVCGWGSTAYTVGVVSNDLLQAVIQVQSDSSSCSTSSTSSVQFCAGYSGTDVCHGDSGSPFMISLNNSWTCAGIVSAGQSCSGNSYYTRVSAFQSFINGVING